MEIVGGIDRHVHRQILLCVHRLIDRWMDRHGDKQTDTLMDRHKTHRHLDRQTN